MPDRVLSGLQLDRRTLLRGVGAAGVMGVMPAAASAELFGGADAIQKIVDAKIAARKFPGAVISLGTGVLAPQVVEGGTLDFDSADKADRHTLWRLASLTKPVAGMAAMLLVGEGRIKLDQPVADFIPEFANLRVFASPAGDETRPVTNRMTIRHLVTHTNGLVSAPVGRMSEAYAKLGINRRIPGAAGVAMAPPQSLKEWAERVAQAPLAVEPGTKWIYSTGLDVIGRVIEVVSGLPFDVFLERRLFAPLGMNSTYFWVPERDKARLATMYAQRDGQIFPTDRGPTSSLLVKPAIPRASGGLISTAHDYDRFMQMVVNYGTLDGTTVIPEEAVKLGTSNILPPGTDMSEYTSKTGADGFGSGGMVTIGGRRAGTYGWGGSSGTTGFMNPALKSRWGSFTNVGASSFGREALAAAGMDFGCDPRRGISCD